MERIEMSLDAAGVPAPLSFPVCAHSAFLVGQVLNLRRGLAARVA